MGNIETNDPFEASLNNMHELETFLRAFLGKLDEHKLKLKEDVTHYAKEFSLELPAVLKGANFDWDGAGQPHREAAHGRAQTLVLAQPGPPRSRWAGHPKHRGFVFTPKEFAHLGTRAAVDQALSRLQRRGQIRRLTRVTHSLRREFMMRSIFRP